ncbi:MAG: hypothetical protein RBU45_26385 [Myxococcota bacterium]|jgi:hypothetical protein|nr:hypothetical protein [Myxococcota bacterium]
MLAEAAKAEPGQPDSRKVVVCDSGMGGEANLAALDALPAPPDRISAVPLRNNKFGREEVIGRVGRYRQHPTKPNLKLRTVYVPADQSPSGRGSRWIATRNHKDRERQHRKIERHVQQVEAVLAQDDRAEGHGQQLQELLTHRTLKGYLSSARTGRALSSARSGSARRSCSPGCIYCGRPSSTATRWRSSPLTRRCSRSRRTSASSRGR